MIFGPKIGDPVRVHYRASMARIMPLHGQRGVIRIVCRGPGPRNHGVEIDGQVYSVPMGNLVRA